MTDLGEFDALLDQEYGVKKGRQEGQPHLSDLRRAAAGVRLCRRLCRFRAAAAGWPKNADRRMPQRMGRLIAGPRSAPSSPAPSIPTRRGRSNRSEIFIAAPAADRGRALGAGHGGDPRRDAGDRVEGICPVLCAQADHRRMAGSDHRSRKGRCVMGLLNDPLFSRSKMAGGKPDRPHDSAIQAQRPDKRHLTCAGPATPEPVRSVSVAGRTRHRGAAPGAGAADQDTQNPTHGDGSSCRRNSRN